MNWLMHNAIADLYGPYFLAFYAITIVTLVVACYKSIRSLDRTTDLELPEIPAKPDPYEIAYLRGGENEVTRVAIASLIQRGLLKVTRQKQGSKTIELIDKGLKPAWRDLSPIEARIMKWSGFPAAPAQIFQSGGIPALITETCAQYHDDLAEKNLLAPPEMKQLGAWLLTLGWALIMGLGAYKVAVAAAKGHRNVGFLIVIGGFGLFALAVVCLVLPRTSRLGTAYLEQLKLAYSGLKNQVHPIDDVNSALTMAGDPGARGRLKDPSVYSPCLLMVGIFGIASLTDTPMSGLTTMFKQGASSSGGCGGGCGGGAGCGGGGGGCGGGCGGCGG
jgi:uncharacterized protein (TIGR04222 family)